MCFKFQFYLSNPLFHAKKKTWLSTIDFGLALSSVKNNFFCEHLNLWVISIDLKIKRNEHDVRTINKTVWEIKRHIKMMVIEKGCFPYLLKGSSPSSCVITIHSWDYSIYSLKCINSFLNQSKITMTVIILKSYIDD